MNTEHKSPETADDRFVKRFARLMIVLMIAGFGLLVYSHGGVDLMTDAERLAMEGKQNADQEALRRSLRNTTLTSGKVTRHDPAEVRRQEREASERSERIIEEAKRLSETAAAVQLLLIANQ